MTSQKDLFDVSGPTYLTYVNWWVGYLFLLNLEWSLAFKLKGKTK